MFFEVVLNINCTNLFPIGSNNQSWTPYQGWYIQIISKPTLLFTIRTRLVLKYWCVHQYMHMYPCSNRFHKIIVEWIFKHGQNHDKTNHNPFSSNKHRTCIFEGFFCKAHNTKLIEFTTQIIIIPIIFYYSHYLFGFCFASHYQAYSQLRYPKGQFNGKRITKDNFGLLLHLLFHDYSGLVYAYN